MVIIYFSRDRFINPHSLKINKTSRNREAVKQYSETKGRSQLLQAPCLLTVIVSCVKGKRVLIRAIL